MRDPKAYTDAGRNDPLDDQQRREHPYDFVSLPASPVRAEAPTLERYHQGRLSGTLELTYRVETPMHVGSGTFDTAAECGLDGGESPVRGMVRSAGRPVLPGSSWKGAVRARFEAITRSRLGLRPRDGKEPGFKVPGLLKQGSDRQGPYQVRLEDPRLRTGGPPRIVKRAEDLHNLSPADALFGAMGYRGRVLPGEGRVEGPVATEPLAVAPLESPAHHRLAKPGKIENVGYNKLEIREVEGRKFYYDGDVVHQRAVESGRGSRISSEDIDHVPAGAKIHIEVRLDSLSDAELGALLIAAGYREDSGILRFGGHKPNGLGKVKLIKVRLALYRGPELRRWKRPDPEELDPQALAEAALGTLVDPGALAELHEVTTRRRPPGPRP